MIAGKYKIIFLAALWLTIGSQIPFLSIPIILLAMPLLITIPGMREISPLVKWSVLGFVPQKPWVWIMLIVYYFFLAWAFAVMTGPRSEGRR